MTAPPLSLATKRGDVYRPSACPRETSVIPSAFCANSDRRIDLLDLHRFEANGVVERERAVEDCTGDLTAVGHLAQRARLDCRWHLRIDGLHRRQDRDAHLGKAQRMRKVDCVLDDV